MQDLEVNSAEYLENQQKIRESKKREGEFRKAILSLQEEEKQWAGVRALLDGEDSLSLIEIYQFVLYCHEKSLLYTLLFAEDIRASYTTKKPLDLGKRTFSTFLDENNETAFLLENVVKDHQELVKSVADKLDSEQAGQSLFAEFDPIISRTSLIYCLANRLSKHL